MDNAKKLGKRYVIDTIVNSIRLGISRSYYMDWAIANGYAKTTAAKYWQEGKKEFENRQKSKY